MARIVRRAGSHRWSNGVIEVLIRKNKAVVGNDAHPFEREHPDLAATLRTVVREELKKMEAEGLL